MILAIREDCPGPRTYRGPTPHPAGHTERSMNTSLRLPKLSRALAVAVNTAVITLLVFYGVLMETDYGKALFFTYDEIWDTAEKHGSSGNLREAERLIRHIVAMEENRVTLKFGLFVLFAGPDYLVHAKLKLAELHWLQGRPQEADGDYRDALATVVAMSGATSWRCALAHFQYAVFLAETGRTEGAREHLASAEEVIRAAHRRWAEDGGPIWEEDEEANRRPVLEDLSRKISVLRDKHGLGSAEAEPPPR